jgi:hypothetical protein
LSLSVRCISCKQQMVGSCFLNQFAILCLLIGELRPFTSVIILTSMKYFQLFCCFSEVYFPLIPCLPIYFINGVYSFFHLPGCIYLFLLCVKLL